MNKIKLLFAGIGVFGVLFLMPVLGVAQAVLEPSYEVSLHLLMMGAKESAPKATLPSNLSTVSQQMKLNYGLSNYRLVGTFLGRVGSAGNFEAKSGLNIGTQTTAQPPSLFEWTVNNLKSGPTSKGGTGFQAQSLRIQARTPMATVISKDESGKDRSIFNYENFGFSISRVGFQENVPVLIGTLNLPGAEDTVFVVMTVKTADQ